MRSPALVQHTSDRTGSTDFAIVSSRTRHLVSAAPVLIAVGVLIGLLVPATRNLTFAIAGRGERKPVEVLTFLFLLAGGLWGLALARRAKRAGAETMVWMFYTLFALGLLWTGMEEIAWGQAYLGYRTPELMHEINAQDEMTLHNIRGLQGHSEWFRLAFGLGGLVGLALARTPRYRAIATPRLLLTWLVVITVSSAVDELNDHISLGGAPDFAVNTLSETVEMLIGMTGFLYVWVHLARWPAGAGHRAPERG
jgi:hypothetical protein